jgi:hypothetical protein
MQNAPPTTHWEGDAWSEITPGPIHETLAFDVIVSNYQYIGYYLLLQVMMRTIHQIDVGQIPHPPPSATFTNTIADRHHSEQTSPAHK